MVTVQIRKPAWLILVFAAWASVVHAAGLKPVDVAAFFVTPNEPAVLRWEVESGEFGRPLPYTIRDYGGKPVASGRAKQTTENIIEVAVKLRSGFYDVELPAAKQRFGVVSLPAYRGGKDPFFCIDSALSWLERDDKVRAGLISALQRSGVAMSRERLNWADISPADGKWNWEGSVRNETVRTLHAKHGVDVLEMFHGATSWSGVVGKYPQNLIRTARAWGEIGRRWQATWGALEVWNEPDIHFGAHLPADQYVPLVKTLAYGLSREKIEKPLVGGVFAVYNRPFLDNAARNGLLDCVDAVSFHTYGRAPQMEALIAKYRLWLRAHGREAMPLWITECGRPWQRGPARPPADQDAISALDITMKAVEARACGIARHFPFVYPFYEERNLNFGMMGRRATSLRSMGAYGQLILRLAHKRYLGDLKCDDASIQRARLFGDDRETIAVLYTAQPDAEAKVILDIPVSRAEGIDGRRFEVGEGAAVPVPDGLVYVWLKRDQLGDRLQTETRAMRLGKVSRQDRPQRAAPSPIVLRLQMQSDLLRAGSEGYQLLAENPGRLPLRVRVFNLDQRAHDLTLRLTFSPQAPRVIGAETRPLRVPAEEFLDVVWEVDFRGAFAATGRLEATIAATGRHTGPVTPLAIDLTGQTSRAQMLKR